MIPWNYHRLTPRDQAGDLLRVVNFQFEETGPDTVIQYEVPSEKLLLITAANWYFNALAAAGSPTILFAITQDTTTVLNMPMLKDATQSVTVPFVGNINSIHRNGSPWLMVPPLHVINSIMIGGSVASAHIFSFNGILIPHGTFSE